MNHAFANIKELLTALKREEQLLSEMFGKRKTIDYKYSDAEEIVDYDNSRLEFLLNYTVIRENEGNLELDDNYLAFFEKVLEVNEKINLSYIDEKIQLIKENIEYYLNENSDRRKYDYLKVIKKIFRAIGRTTLRSVIDLRRNIENTFKNEPNYKNKKRKLEHLDEKRTLIGDLVQQTLVLVNEEEHTFFNRALDEELSRIIVDLKFQLTECSHNLIEIEKQIINYLNQISAQGEFINKLRKIKYLRDQLILETQSDVRHVLKQQNDVIFNKRQSEPIKLSIDYLRDSPRAFETIKKQAQKRKDRRLHKPKLANKISKDFLENAVEEEVMIDLESVKNQFLATSDNLFNFLLRYNFPREVNFNERVTLFCQLVSQFDRELRIENETVMAGDIECALVYAK